MRPKKATAKPRSKRSQTERAFVYKGNAEARAVALSMTILDMIVELGERPTPSDLADVLDRHMALQPGRIPQNVRVAIMHLLRTAAPHKRSITIDRFLEKYDAAVPESIALQRALKEDGAASPYDTANRRTARKYGIGTKKLETLRTLYRKRFPSDD